MEFKYSILLFLLSFLLSNTIWPEPETPKEEKSFLSYIWTKPKPVKKSFISYFWSEPEEKSIFSYLWGTTEPVKKSIFSYLWTTPKPVKNEWFWFKEWFTSDLKTTAIHIANKVQTRFSFITPKDVNPDVVVAGIKDNSLGAKGRPIIRICNPAKNPESLSTYHRLVVDPKGFRGKNNLHVPLPSSIVTLSGYTQKTLGYIFVGLNCFAWSNTVFRLWNASKNEKRIIPETALVSAEYAGGYVSGATGYKLGTIVGLFVAGPPGAFIGAVAGSILGSFSAIELIKSQEKLIVETTKKLKNNIYKYL